MLSNSSGQTRTSLFKKAISLNPEHQQTFLLQKQKNTGNTEAMKKIAENSLNDTIAIYDQLIIKEKNDLVKVKLIEEGLQKIYNFNSRSDDLLRDEAIEGYLKQLKYILMQTTMIRDFYKYSVLAFNYAEFYKNKEYSLYFYQIAICILEKSSRSELDSHELENLKAKFLQISDQYFLNLSDDRHKEAMAEADKILTNKEDKELKASVSEVKQMMFAFHEELRNIKAQNQGQSSTLEDLELQINQLSIDQFQKDQIIDFNIYEANKHIDLLGDSTKQIKEYIDNVPKNYDLILNNDFKQNISHLIREQVNKNLDNSVVPLIDSINDNSKELIKQLEDFTSSAENSINKINDLREQDIKASKDALTKLTADLNKNALDKITLFKQAASEFNELIIKKITALTEVRDFSDEEKQWIINSLKAAQSFFDSSAKTINLRAGNTDIDLGNHIRMIAGDLQGLVEAQNRNFISLARAFLGNNKKQRTDLTQNSITLSPEVTALQSSDKVETEDTLIIENTRKTSNKRKIIMRILKILLLLILLTLIISGMVVMNSGR